MPLAVFDEHGPENFRERQMLTIAREQRPHFLEQIHELRIGEKLNEDLLLGGNAVSSFGPAATLAIEQRGIDIPGWHRNTNRSHVVPKLEGRPVLGHHALDFPERFTANPVHDRREVLVREDGLNQGHNRKTEITRRQHPENLRETSYTPCRLDATPRPGRRVSELAHAVIEQRAVTQIDVELSALHFIEMMEHAHRHRAFSARGEGESSDKTLVV